MASTASVTTGPGTPSVTAGSASDGDNESPQAMTGTMIRNQTIKEKFELRPVVNKTDLVWDFYQEIHIDSATITELMESNQFKRLKAEKTFLGTAPQKKHVLACNICWNNASITAEQCIFVHQNTSNARAHSKSHKLTNFAVAKYFERRDEPQLGRSSVAENSSQGAIVPLTAYFRSREADADANPRSSKKARAKTKEENGAKKGYQELLTYLINSRSLSTLLVEAPELRDLVWYLVQNSKLLMEFGKQGLHVSRRMVENTSGKQLSFLFEFVSDDSATSHCQMKLTLSSSLTLSLFVCSSNVVST
jgi:hypothetical protein